MNLICTDDARKSSWNCRSPTASLLYNQTTLCLQHEEHVLLTSFEVMVYQLPASIDSLSMHMIKGVVKRSNM